MKKFLVLILCLASAFGINAQEVATELKVDPLEALEVRGRLSLFIEEIETLLANVSSAKQKQLKKAEKSLKGIENKWNVYSGAHQDIIAAEEGLMEVVVNYEEISFIFIGNHFFNFIFFCCFHRCCYCKFSCRES